ncbi:hypothetical protein [Arthrobacter pityocampae]|uniref:hypothetical protein n=1 Tax=Arthrobacter pityocampae TaxID=547334 RepID=UPI003736E622
MHLQHLHRSALPQTRMLEKALLQVLAMMENTCDSRETHSLFRRGTTMNDTTTPSPPNAGEARALLDQANQVGASVRSGASWPAISFLLGLGALSSMGIIAFTYARLTPGVSVALPVVFMGVWLLILMSTVLFFTRSSKHGFGTRWGVYMGLWGALWFAGMLLSGFSFQGELWFAGLVAALLTVSTTSCAWYEARR